MKIWSNVFFVSNELKQQQNILQNLSLNWKKKHRNKKEYIIHTDRENQVKANIILLFKEKRHKL